MHGKTYPSMCKIQSVTEREGNHVNYSSTTFISRLSDFTMAIHVYDFVTRPPLIPTSIHTGNVIGIPVYRECVSHSSPFVHSRVSSIFDDKLYMKPVEERIDLILGLSDKRNSWRLRETESGRDCRVSTIYFPILAIECVCK